MHYLIVALGLIAGTVFGAGQASAAPNDDAVRAERWKDVSTMIFGDRPIEPTDSLVKIEAPDRALDAATVPVTLSFPEKDKIKGVYFLIDGNPSPVAAHVAFGPAADAGHFKMRVRIDNYTFVHAVAETTDGKLYQADRFVKASGGCSAPVGGTEEEAMRGMGEMRFKVAETLAGKPAEATLMIRHPNFNGMQMNQVTRNFTPARYIQKISASVGDQNILTMDTDISLSTNPVIGFSYVPNGGETIKVAAEDNGGGRWEQSFPVPAATN